jgi:quercetin dioxygenase-like cupin family protein
MSAPSGEHGPEHAERISLYAVRALPTGEVPAVEALLAACADCRQELAALGPIVDAFVSWPADVLRPSVSLWERLAGRIAAETGGEPLAPAPGASSWAEPDWSEVAPGISVKLLASDPERTRVSMLVRLAPGTDYPPHIHDGVEELHMLEGELLVGDRRLYAGDYLRSEPGTVDRIVRSETGCTGILVTSPRDVIL